MRIFRSGVLRGVALLALLAISGIPVAYADDLSDPPELRIKPPGGLSSQLRIKPPGGAPISEELRINPPVGAPATETRIGLPPGGGTVPEPSFFTLLMEWMRVQLQLAPTD